MTAALEKSVLRVLNPAGQTTGAAFLVAPDLAVSCAHVVAAAKGLPGQPLALADTRGGRQFPAMLLTEGWSPADRDDLAFLRLDAPPEGLQPAILSTSQKRLNRAFAALGFPPDRNYSADWAQGLLASWVPAPNRADLLRLQGDEIRKGMSGAPVLDTQAEQVVGMVVEYLDSDGQRRAYAVTAETIRTACPHHPLHLAEPCLEIGMEELLRRLLDALREQNATIRVGGDVGGSGATFLIAGSGNVVCLSPHEIRNLNALRPAADPARTEELYLARFILNTWYSRWDREYVPLAGTISEGAAPGMRLYHSADPSIGQAGLQVSDIRQVITACGKTRLVLLGDPGAGKSTTLDRLALDLARRRLADPLAEKIPFRVNLFEFSDANPDPDAFLQRKWTNETGLGDYAAAVNRGEVCFLLDGLNQMPFEHRLDRFDRWTTWVQTTLPPGNWAVFTCRSADFQSSLGLPEVHVQSFDPPRIRQVLEIRFGVDAAAEKWSEFEKLLRGADERFEKLVGNPLMLSLLVRRAAAHAPLTDNRADLMRGLVADRLSHELSFGRQPSELREKPLETLERTVALLERLAYAMQQQRGEGTFFTHSFARDTLSPHAPDWSELLALAGCAGIFNPAFDPQVDTRYAFAHQLLQEYFAAGQLLRELAPGVNLDALWRTRIPFSQYFLPLRKDETLSAPPVTGWEETTRMAAARLPRERVLELVKAVSRANLPLAARCLAEARGAENSWPDPALEATAGKIRRDLLARQRSRFPWSHLRKRIDCGLALGDLGHPDLLPQPFAFEGHTAWAILPKLEPVPAGAFLFGSDLKDKQAYDDEKTTQRRTELPAFSIGRYPVTNAEYRSFLAAGGYADSRWWSAEGWAWRQGGQEAQKGAVDDWMGYRQALNAYGVEKAGQEFHWHSSVIRYWQRVCGLSEEEALQETLRQMERPFDRPAFWDDPRFSAPARPVVGVNWYEAEAYARWLSEVTGSVFRLPEELEWEKAARGSDGRAYPWGKRWDASRCNTLESHIYVTTPVGLSAAGLSPVGAYDVAGNVREWTASWYQSYPGSLAVSEDFGEKYHVVRGGAWSLRCRDARCASRYRLVPDDFDYCLGFRLLSPGAC